ncbi:hypothetical protein ED28_03080 [[Pantoea] beijingensis]|uniref:Uncharacterized protein n=1 Tax=[Pantoea] beijingensis TaxID=1324864 RepID=A0A443IGT2_9GAMM|nr:MULTISPECIES: hypothetical protein [Erwiniaceae]RWR03294.1 hypothetical protein ED28_03080 [[Pantoea] beijingensis]
MTKVIQALIIFWLMAWHNAALAAYSPNVNVEVDAESIAKIVVYYRNTAIISGAEVNFPLVVNGVSQHFERTSDFFYVVGNVEQADVTFTDTSFELYASNGSANKINLAGDFIFNGSTTNALDTLRVPVLNNINEAKVSNGFKVHFKSELLAGNYAQDRYANTFTLLIKSIL